MYTNSNQNQAAQDKTRQKNEIQRQIVMQEADYKKRLNEKIQIESEMRDLKRKEDQIRAGIQEKQSRLSRLEQEILVSDTALKNLRKKLNLV